MRLHFYSVGGTLNAPDDFVGTAHDIRTAISLMRLLGATACTGCRLQGETGAGLIEQPMALSIPDAHLFLLSLLLDPDTPATKLPVPA